MTVRRSFSVNAYIDDDDHAIIVEQTMTRMSVADLRAYVTVLSDQFDDEETTLVAKVAQDTLADWDRQKN